MTLPIKLGPPLDPYHRPARELAGYTEFNVDDGDEILPPVGPATVGESITLYAPSAGRGLLLREQPLALTDYFQLNKVPFDATLFNAARIVVNVRRPGAEGARARLYYSTTGQDGSYVDAGIDLTGATLPLTCKIDKVGVRIGAGPITVAARADVYWAVLWDNGDGSTSPIIGAVFLQFLNATFKDCVWTIIVHPEDMLESGETLHTDLRWSLSGNTGAFQSGCTGPTCLAFIATFRFGTGAPLDADATRVFSVADFADLAPGRFARIRGEMQWSYCFLTCGPEANPDIRLTVRANGVTLTNVPSGFPPYDTSWLPFELVVPADGTGLTFSVGIYGDSGICSASLIGGVRNVQVEVLDEGSDPSLCLTESVNDPEPALPTDVWDWNPTEGAGTTITDKNGSGVDITLVAHGPYSPGVVWATPEAVHYPHTGIHAFNYGIVSHASLTMVQSSQIMYVKMPPAWSEGAYFGGHRGSGIASNLDRKITIDLATGKVSAHVYSNVFPFGIKTVTSTSVFGVDDEFVAAYTHDGATLRLYINGVEEDSIACGDSSSLASPNFMIGGGNTSFSTEGPPSNGGIFASTGPIIGRTIAANRALTEAEVEAFYEAIKAVHTGLP